MLAKILAHPLTRGLAVDDPRTTLLRRQIVGSKPFLRRIYVEWYGAILDALGDRTSILELGSGAGFFKELCPRAIASEIVPISGVDLIADGRALPFGGATLDAIVMTDVFHHIPDVGLFLAEATRAIRPGGKIVMVEPWRTPWSERIYTRLHPEPFEPDAGWELPPAGPLSGANGALPWIVFERDAALFAERFPRWRLLRIAPLMPFAYLWSGGVSMRPLAPGWMYWPIRALESRLAQNRWAMFALIELELRP